MKNQIETTYDDMPYADKEMAGLPVRYFLLDNSLKLFLENFAESLDKPDQSDNIEDIGMTKELINEAADILKAVAGRMQDNAK